MDHSTVCLLFGGGGPEHEVSLRSAASLSEELCAAGAEFTCIGVDKARRWFRVCASPDSIRSGSWERSEHRSLLSFRKNSIFDEETQKPLFNPIVFPAMHGIGYEDGRLQGFLDTLDIPYVGSGQETSAVAMNKILTAQVLTQHRIPMARRVFGRIETEGEIAALVREAERTLAYPMFVKPARSGSSIGSGYANNQYDLSTMLYISRKTDSYALVEAFITGKEVEVAVFDDGKRHIVSSPGELSHHALFYDYEAKYRGQGAEITIPAKLSEGTAKTLQSLADRVFSLLACRHFARVDFFVGNRGEILFNEINTLPGMTENSMFPRLMQASGISLAEIVLSLCEAARQEHRARSL